MAPVKNSLQKMTPVAKKMSPVSKKMSPLKISNSHNIKYNDFYLNMIHFIFNFYNQYLFINRLIEHGVQYGQSCRTI